MARMQSLLRNVRKQLKPIEPVLSSSFSIPDCSGQGIDDDAPLECHPDTPDRFFAIPPYDKDDWRAVMRKSEDRQRAHLRSERGVSRAKPGAR